MLLLTELEGQHKLVHGGIQPHRLISVPGQLVFLLEDLNNQGRQIPLLLLFFLRLLSLLVFLLLFFVLILLFFLFLTKGLLLIGILTHL